MNHWVLFFNKDTSSGCIKNTKSVYWLYLDEGMEHPGGSFRSSQSKKRRSQLKSQGWYAVTEPGP